MNRIFFGDARDLFKFDLVRHIMKAFPDLLSFTFVPMLTEEEPATGKKKTRAKNPQLKTRLYAVLGDYADKYNTLIACDCGKKP
jgi:hypothetical protein